MKLPMIDIVMYIYFFFLSFKFIYLFLNLALKLIESCFSVVNLNGKKMYIFALLVAEIYTKYMI